MHASLGGGGSGGSGFQYTSLGDLATYQIASASITKDGAWHTLDISAYIPVDAKFVVMKVVSRATTASKFIYITPYGDHAGINGLTLVTQVANTYNYGISPLLSVDSNRRVEYNVQAATWRDLMFAILGYWK